MRGMILNTVGQPLQIEELPIPEPQANQVLLKVHVCGVCRTDLHIVDGELERPKVPLVLGHQIIGTVVKTGEQARKYSLGTRVGVPWLGHTCNCCRYCLAEKENLCDRALFTGYDLNGGYAEYTKRTLQDVLAVRSQFNIGLDVFDSSINEDPIPDSRFFAWRGRGQYVRRIGQK